MNDKRLPVALVTGAAGGIGKAAAQALARAGYQVFGTSRSAASAAPAGITMLVCDVTNDESVKRAVKDVVARAARIDLLVNNAGLGLIGGAEESSVAQAQHLFDVNVFGILRMTNEVLPIMRNQGEGRIINISSVLGFLPGTFTAVYASPKHADEGYSESLDYELRTFGIRVSLIEPAFTRTAIEEHGEQPDRISSVYDNARSAKNTPSPGSSRSPTRRSHFRARSFRQERSPSTRRLTKPITASRPQISWHSGRWVSRSRRSSASSSIQRSARRRLWGSAARSRMRRPR